MSSAIPPDLEGLDYVQPLGSGGYADVYLYEQQMPRMKVAVKVLKTEGLTPTIQQQFIDEANTMAQLADHPYIVQVFRAGTSRDGRPFLVMKYYPPPNLAQRARTARFSVEEVLRTGIQLASAVETAHRAGVIHRDIKPANVLVSQYGSPGLTDFGIAGRGGAAEEVDEDLGVSVPWSPPEVLFGHSNGDARADVYALSATLWQLLVGRSPFEVPGGNNSAFELMPRIRSTPPPSTDRADVPQSLERLLAQAMSKNPLARPASAIEFARSLQQIEQEERFSRTAIVVLDELGHSGDSGALGNTRDRTQLRASTGSGSRPTTSMPPPPLGQPVIGGQLSGGRGIGHTGSVPIADGVVARSGRQPAPPSQLSGPRPPQASGPRPPQASSPRPPQASSPRPPQMSGPRPAPYSGPRPPQASGPRSQGSGPVPTKAAPRRWLPMVAGVCGVLLLVAIVGTALALGGRGGGPGTQTQTDTSLASAPTFTMTVDSSVLEYTIDYAGYQKGDRYLVKAALSKDVIDKATAYGVSDIDEATGKGSFSQEFGSAPRQCAKVRVQRGEDYSPWSETMCKDKG
ncbi:serine/threonine protein kinase [Janibacter sp. Soil728]|uniref:serine/threonine protein kinase n=1 Tax=Janibacter sp. Soil728 TaxID=1736393 RepID=UPI000B0E7044|nr:serine/threonine-protein kinase [Janibacter sp. Soil728]